jgi:ribosomal protein L7/L12
MKRIQIEDVNCRIELVYDDALVAQQLVKHLTTAVHFDVSNLKVVTLTGFTRDKIVAIKAVRTVCNCSLKDGKRIVEDAQDGGAPVLFDNLDENRLESVSEVLTKGGVLFRIG